MILSEKFQDETKISELLRSTVKDQEKVEQLQSQIILSEAGLDETRKVEEDKTTESNSTSFWKWLIGLGASALAFDPLLGSLLVPKFLKDALNENNDES